MKTSVHTSETTGLLISGGLDSSILLAQLLEQGRRVQPLYVSTGSAWQQAERRALQKFVEALDNQAIEPIVELQMPIDDLYGNHWSITGQNVPDQTTSDEAVFLWGRNPLLLLKAMLWCSMHNIDRLALATLRCNPFADATPRFFGQFEQALATAIEKKVTILRPFEKLAKQQVIALGAELPLHLTFSCLAPQENRHCGACNKCAERAHVLRSMPGGDPTPYAYEMRLAEHAVAN